MTTPELLTLMAFAPYVLLMATLRYGWGRVRQVRLGVKPAAVGTQISVVIPMRNEAGYVNRLFKALALQDYPAERWEVIVVNDHSQDATRELLNQWATHPKFRLHILESGVGEAGKKAALSRGIARASGELIVTTDADCRMGPAWLTSLAACYEQHTPHLIFAPVLFEERSPFFFTRLQSLEHLTLLATAAGSSQLGRALFCNAANMAFPRRVFYRLDDPMGRHFASGDDTMMLLKMKKMDPAKVVFHPRREAMVLTEPMTRFGDFWNQRKRWASKSRHYRDPDILTTGVVVLLTNLCLVFLLAGSFFSSVFTGPLLTGFAVKMAIDALLVWPVMKYYNRQHLAWTFIPGQLLYPFYSSLSAIAGRMSGFTWKNRHYHVN